MSIFVRKIQDLLLYAPQNMVANVCASEVELEKLTKVYVKATIIQKVEDKNPEGIAHVEELTNYCMRLHKESLGNPGAGVLAEQIGTFLRHGVAYEDILSMPTEDYLKEMRRVLFP